MRAAEVRAGRAAHRGDAASNVEAELRIVSALIADPADARTLEQWAAWANLAPRTLSRRFVVETGMSLTNWRQRVRMLRSLELLAAGLPVTTVAFDLGYDNVSAFIALFRRTFGTTPGRYFAVGFKPAEGAQK